MSEFVPRTTLERMAVMRGDDAGAVARAALAYLDRAERAEAMWNEHVNANDCLRQVWRERERAERAEQEAARERARAEKWKALATRLDNMAARGLTCAHDWDADLCALCDFRSLLAAENTTARPEEESRG